jgi:RNA polymerase sigma-B factor
MAVPVTVAAGGEPETGGPANRAEQDRALFARYLDKRDPVDREMLVERFLPLARQLARRYQRPEEPFDDLFQVACLGLLNAIDRFDLERGIAFSSYAVPTILGEIKRYFRDRTWSVRPPRRSQELHLELRRTEEDLAQTLGRSPTVAELAATLDVSEDHVLEALEAGVAHQAASLDHAPGGDDDAPTRGERLLAEAEPGYGDVDRRLIVKDLMQELPERERSIVYMRFFENMTQPEIAERVGVSQSYLSRILRKALVDLRSRMPD